MIKIKILTDRESPYIASITEWQYEQWGKDLGQTKEIVRTYIENSLCENRIPQTIVAVENGNLLGYCNINMFDDLVQYPHIYPWLRYIYVDKAERGRGIARKLLEFIPTAMKNLNIPELYLLTNHSDFYEKFGWEYACDLATQSKTVGDKDGLYGDTVRLYKLSCS
jgi:N-acetylglutamate synthase-like GNAT family acetyltransferase